MLEESYRDNKRYLLMLVLPITVLAKFIQFNFLPDKYFYDSSRMLSMLNNTGDMPAWGGGYEVVVNVFKKINFLGFTTLNEWAIFLATIFGIMLVFMIARLEDMDIVQTIFMMASIGLLNIYVFNISKEIIQYGIFMLMYIIVIQKKIKPPIKVILCFGVFYWESTFFRSYYILMGALFVLVYCIFKKIQIDNKPIKAGTVCKILIIIFFAVFVLLFLSKYISYEDYQMVLGVSESHENLGATSAIVDLIPVNGNLGLFMLNYVINAVRMMIPVELLTNGVFYVPFVLFQVFVLYYFVKSLKKLNRDTSDMEVIALAAFCGYLLGSFLFETVFGSFVRHEAATFPILHVMAVNKSNYFGKNNKVKE